MFEKLQLILIIVQLVSGTHHHRVKRVVGGDIADSDDLGWNVLIVTRSRGNVERCGGTLISEDFILTSATCVQDVDSVDVYLGVSNLRGLTRNSRVLSVRIRSQPLIHPDLTQSSTSVFNNFALLELPAPINFSRYPHIQPACLPRTRNIRIEGKVGVTGGFGDTRVKNYVSRLRGRFQRGNGHRPSNDLRHLQVNILDQNNCNDLFTKLSSSFAVDNENVCVTSSSGGGLCQGDRGAGLVINDDDDGPLLVGVSSYDIGCNSTIDNERLPNVFGRISSVLAWLQRETSIRTCSRPTPVTRPPPTRAPTPGTTPSSCSCGKSPSHLTCPEKIAGGSEACKNEFPWAALLTINRKGRCGGSLLNDRYILTAGHCFDNISPRDVVIDVVLGNNKKMVLISKLFF